MEVVKITANELANRAKELTVNSPNHLKTRENDKKCIASILVLCKEYGYRYTIKESKFFDFIDMVIRQVKFEESVVVVSAPSSDSFMTVTEKLRLLNKYAFESMAAPDESLCDEYIIYCISLDREKYRERYDIDYATKLLKS